jgi:hypothetical protein
VRVAVRKDLGTDLIPDTRENYRGWYSRQEIDGQEVLYQHPETGDVVVLLDGTSMAVLYSIDLDFEGEKDGE